LLKGIALPSMMNSISLEYRAFRRCTKTVQQRGAVEESGL
jgi:hypothetical protein